MTTLFNRVVKVTAFRENVPKNPTSFSIQRTATSVEVEKLRVQFRIHKSLTKNPNQCDVTITNLADSSRVDFETKPLLVQLDAGYADDALRLLFVGDLRFGMSKEEGPNWETLLQLGDGDCMHRWARVNRSYAPGTKVRAVLKDAAASMGFDLPKNLASDSRLDQTFSNGRTSHTWSRNELEKLLLPYGYTHSIQNGVLRVLKSDEVVAGTAVPIGEGFGMIGSPEFGSPPRSGKPPHVFVDMLLYPELQPGILVELKSRSKSGRFRVETVRHEGDTHGEGNQSWTTRIEIKPV